MDYACFLVEIVHFLLVTADCVWRSCPADIGILHRQLKASEAEIYVVHPEHADEANKRLRRELFVVFLVYFALTSKDLGIPI